MSKKLFSPGEIVENSGLYPVVGPRGGDKGYEVTVVKGEPFPPLPEKGWGFSEPRLTKTAAEDSGEAMVVYSPSELPDHRPVHGGNPTLVPSETLPSSRPILVGTRQVTSFDHLPQHRPVFQSDLDIVAMFGNRPVVRLNSSLTPSASLPGNRPIADNSSLSSGNLMGYLD
ncbi:hypothetical protein C1752_03492 [Acaryochloris thomasi RCC1774]|uniref:Uncharacterized protein n=1 Tax=Acaryochloris thomasi RCC1774 TaxID=1764569 RepID=A0A2W1JGZ7_9CYAN|nr:hypothetical protein [Acaryochloris thomasi]PZD72656.1 hypothetical protein C1752_03492 [Acaryochloris thomasi RCC1774]